jgi:hypothetical protein
MPLIRGRWFSSTENGQRLGEAARFSLEMLTTLGWTLRTASTTGVRRALDPACACTGSRQIVKASNAKRFRPNRCA